MKGERKKHQWRWCKGCKGLPCLCFRQENKRIEKIRKEKKLKEMKRKDMKGGACKKKKASGEVASTCRVAVFLF